MSQGCAHCYAERMAVRLAGRFGYPAAPDQFRVTVHPERLEEPEGWSKPQRVFVDSMSDLFHKDVPDLFIHEVFAMMDRADWHTYLVLTKRPERMREFMVEWCKLNDRRPLRNVWLGVSVEDQRTADLRVPALLSTPAAVRFVSCEPLLGAVDLLPFLVESPEDCSQFCPPDVCIDWVICGGESGPGARPMCLDWPRALRDQCQVAMVPFLFKQWGEWAPYQDVDCNGEVRLWHAEDGLKHFWEMGETVSQRCGKKAAGRDLDGVLWDEYPREVGRE